MTTPFDSPRQLQSAFVHGLQQMLEAPGLGATILVLANASFDPAILEHLRQPLRQRFEWHAAQLRKAFADGHAVPEAADDLLVFLKLMALGFDGITVTERRRAGDWELQFNLLRAFRPKRLSDSVAAGIRVPFNGDGFHFNKPFLRAETFWSGHINGHDVDLLYNKFPFVESHGLLVPDREQCLPQYLDQQHHRFAWALTAELGENLPGLGFAYNSYGAFASVNHLHLQMFLREQPLPIMEPHWRHNGGADVYPARCEVFDHPLEAWAFIASLHDAGQPYNLLYLPGKLLCVPRARQGSYPQPEWTAGFAWYEMFGGAVAFNREDYQALDGDTLGTALAQAGRIQD